MRYSELKRLLRANECEFVSEGGRHEKWRSERTGLIIEIPRHISHEVPSGMLDTILKKAGIK